MSADDFESSLIVFGVDDGSAPAVPRPRMPNMDRTPRKRSQHFAETAQGLDELGTVPAAPGMADGDAETTANLVSDHEHESDGSLSNPRGTGAALGFVADGDDRDEYSSPPFSRIAKRDDGELPSPSGSPGINAGMHGLKETLAAVVALRNAMLQREADYERSITRALCTNPGDAKADRGMVSETVTQPAAQPATERTDEPPVDDTLLPSRHALRSVTEEAERLRMELLSTREAAAIASRECELLRSEHTLAIEAERAARVELEVELHHNRQLTAVANDSVNSLAADVSASREREIQLQRRLTAECDDLRSQLQAVEHKAQTAESEVVLLRKSMNEAAERDEACIRRLQLRIHDTESALAAEQKKNAASSAVNSASPVGVSESMPVDTSLPLMAAFQQTMMLDWLLDAFAVAATLIEQQEAAARAALWQPNALAAAAAGWSSTDDVDAIAERTATATASLRLQMSRGSVLVESGPHNACAACTVEMPPLQPTQQSASLDEASTPPSAASDTRLSAAAAEHMLSRMEWSTRFRTDVVVLLNDVASMINQVQRIRDENAHSTDAETSSDEDDVPAALAASATRMSAEWTRSRGNSVTNAAAAVGSTTSQRPPVSLLSKQAYIRSVGVDLPSAGTLSQTVAEFSHIVRRMLPLFIALDNHKIATQTFRQFKAFSSSSPSLPSMSASGRRSTSMIYNPPIVPLPSNFFPADVTFRIKHDARVESEDAQTEDLSATAQRGPSTPSSIRRKAAAAGVARTVSFKLLHPASSDEDEDAKPPTTHETKAVASSSTTS